MQTQLLQADAPGAIQTAAAILQNGGLVGIPTETVYGLAANALDGAAVAKIFAAKGRPMDNPLIVHISHFEQIYDLVREVPEAAKKLAEQFWPGPLTIILPKSARIPDEVSAGLDTVAVRFPSHPVARAVIDAAGVPLAAPSGNLSGHPSPTTAAHVMNDMDGRIEAVLDGGPCSVGVESTVVTLAEQPPRLLRPGGITLEQLRGVLGQVEMDDAVLHPLADGKRAASPGMKYKHYSPKANVIILDGSLEHYIDYVNTHAGDGVAALCYDGEDKALQVPSICYGGEEDCGEQARELFDALRELDERLHAKTVYARCPEPEGVGLAVYNRLIRAAGFEVIDVGLAFCGRPDRSDRRGEIHRSGGVCFAWLRCDRLRPRCAGDHRYPRMPFGVAGRLRKRYCVQWDFKPSTFGRTRLCGCGFLAKTERRHPSAHHERSAPAHCSQRPGHRRGGRGAAV